MSSLVPQTPSWRHWFPRAASTSAHTWGSAEEAGPYGLPLSSGGRELAIKVPPASCSPEAWRGRSARVLLTSSVCQQSLGLRPSPAAVSAMGARCLSLLSTLVFPNQATFWGSGGKDSAVSEGVRRGAARPQSSIPVHPVCSQSALRTGSAGPSPPSWPPFGLEKSLHARSAASRGQRREGLAQFGNPKCANPQLLQWLPFWEIAPVCGSHVTQAAGQKLLRSYSSPCTSSVPSEQRARPELLSRGLRAPQLTLAGHVGQGLLGPALSSGLTLPLPPGSPQSRRELT